MKWQVTIGVFFFSLYHYSIACADPSLFYLYDEQVLGMKLSTNKITPDSFLATHLTNYTYVKSDRLKIEMPEFYESNRIKFKFDASLCANQQSCELNVYSINHMALLKTGAEKSQDVYTSSHVLTIDLIKYPISEYTISIKQPYYYTAVIATVGAAENEKDETTLHYDVAESRSSCSWFIYVEEKHTAGYLNYCESTSRGGYYDDPWTHDVENAICSGYSSY